MADVLRRFISRLSREGVGRLFARADLSLPDLELLGPRQRTKAALDTVLGTDDDVRGQLEGIAGHIVALADKGDHAELALRAVCEGRQELSEILEDDRSLEERILNVSFREPKLLDRARNLAMTLAWKEGRYHAGFTVSNPQNINEDIEEAVEAIRCLVQGQQGGRKVYTENFTYSEPDRAELPEHGSTERIHHIAIYLEAPASLLMEFKAGDSKVTPVLRHQAREMAIDYNPASGRLDVVGKGVGGGQVFRRVAEEFRFRALADASITELKHAEWPLDLFLRDEAPSLSPPAGFSSVRVTELLLRSQRQHGGRAEFRAGRGMSAYDRMREVSVSLNRLNFERVSSVTLTLRAVPATEDEPEKDVRATLKWPNALSFDGAGVQDRREITEWLKERAFAGLVP